MANEQPYPAAFRSGDLVAVSGRLGVTQFFAEPRPARSCIGAAALPDGAVVEVEALARVRDV
jgi:enamine deaminase RidA (YjgF/YER057c/UK114 family)